MTSSGVTARRCLVCLAACLALGGCGSHRLTDRSWCTSWNSAGQKVKEAYAKTRSFPSSELKGRTKVGYIDANCDLPTAQILGGIR